MIILLLVGIAVVPIIWGSLKIIQHQRVERQQFLELNYQKGIECLTTLDYRCANDFFQKVYLKDKNFEKCLNFLIEANFGNATTYFENGQISKSIEVLNYIVSLDPGNNQALILLDRYHKILGTEYKNQGNWQRAIDEFSLALIAMPDDFSTRDEIDEVFKLWIKEAKAKGEILKVWQLKNKLDIFKNK